MLEQKILENAKKCVETLKNNNLKIATAESCTGGMVSRYITAISGASCVFELGVCSYSVRIKNEFLGIDKSTLEKFGAVSMQTAKEMAENVMKMANADIGVSVTGSAGPGACEGHPMGCVFIAVATKYSTQVKLLDIEPVSREHVRLTAVLELFELINKKLGEYIK